MKVGILHTAFIGDVALLGLLVEGLSQAGHAVVLITKPICGQLYENDKRVSEILKIKKNKGFKKIASTISIAKEIRNLELDVLLCPHLSLTSALICKLSKTKKTIGFDKSAGRFLFDKVVEWKKEAHECIRLLEIATTDLIPIDLMIRMKKYGKPFLRSQSPLSEFEKNFPDFFKLQDPYFVISPGSVWKTKKYPAAFFAQVVEEVLNLFPKLRCVVNGGPDDKKDIELFFQALQKDKKYSSERIVDAASSLSVTDMVSLLRGALFSIANDSGPMHVACGVSCPVVAIYGPTPIDTGMNPVGENTFLMQYNKLFPERALLCQPCSPHGGDVCPAGHHMCMLGLPPATVFETVKLLIEKLQREIK